MNRNEIIESFLSTKGEDKYEDVLRKAQSYISAHLPKDVDKIEEKQLKEIIERYIIDYSVKCEVTDSIHELTNYLYHDMSGYSFITREKLFEQDGFEELNITAWNNVEMKIYGKTYKTNYSFLSPQHAIDIHRRMLRKTGTVIDDAVPRAIADLGSNIRICAEKYPLVDETVGISSSIRKVSLNVVSPKKLIEGQMLSEEMFRFLRLCLEYGVSMCISGETGAGKTTFAGGLLAMLADRLRIITIEEGSREWDFVIRDENGKPTNSVVHLKTRPSENHGQNITQEQLVADSLRLDPDIIAPGEVRGREAFETMSAANTGHTVVTTLHSNGAIDTPERLVTLAKKAYDMDDKTLFSMEARAFQILVHAEKFADNSRRITQIYEVLGYENGEMKYNPIFEFEIEDNVYDENDKVTVIGKFKRLNPISKKLAQRMLKKGVRRSEILPFLGEVT